jgi:hypothetical protein
MLTPACAAGRGERVTVKRRGLALAILLGMLALPVLGLFAGDACCAGSPCAPGGAPCTTLGATPCCDADRGAAGAVDLGAWSASLALLPSAGWLAAFERASDPPTRIERECPTAGSPLRFSVVLRI